MPDGVGEDVGLASTILPRVLLTPEDDGLCAIDAVDAVYDGIQALHLLELLGVEVEKVQLARGIRTNAHEDDAGFLIVVALDVDVA